MRKGPSIIVWFLGVAAAYWLAGEAGLWMRGSAPVATFWPAAGVSFALLSVARLKGPAIWLAALFGVATATFLANLSNGSSFALAGAFTAANTVEPLIGSLVYATALRRFPNPSATAIRLLFAAVPAVLAATLIADLVCAPLLDAEAAEFAFRWFTTDLAGIALVATPILVWTEWSAPTVETSTIAFERILQSTVVICLTAIGIQSDSELTLMAITVPALLWGAVRLGPRHMSLELAAWGLILSAAGERQFGALETVTTEGHLIPFTWLVASLVLALLTVCLVSAKVAETDARASDEALRFRLLAENASGLLLLCDGQGTVQWASPSGESMTGWQRKELEGRRIQDLVFDEDSEMIDELVSRTLEWNREEPLEWPAVRLVTVDGEPRWFDGRVSVLTESATPRLAIGLRDIDAHRIAHEQLAAAAAELRHRSETDELTGLLNRRGLRDNLGTALVHSRAGGTLVGVIYMDLDHFKHINDALTHAGGDQLLKVVSDRMRSALRQGDIVARMGGDEFVAVLSGLKSEDNIRIPLENLRAAIEQRIEIEGESIRVTASAGVVISDGAAAPDELLRDADQALYRAKAAGRNRWELFDEAADREATQRLHLENEIHVGLANNEFLPWYQPVVDLTTHEVIGFEALARWAHPERGWLPPFEFIPVAEQGPLIIGIDQAVISEAISMLGRLPEKCSMAVNVSATTLARGGMDRMILTELDRRGVDPSRLDVELTETALFDISESRIAELDALRERGVSVYVDDFGVGFSSISHLRDLPVSGLKLDRSFTSGVEEVGSKSHRLSIGLCGLASALGLSAVAEGVETEEQARVLAEQGWPKAQGYYFGRPSPVPETRLRRDRS